MTVHEERTRDQGRFVVRAEKWSGGWDLIVEGELMPGGGITQVTQLIDASATT